MNQTVAMQPSARPWAYPEGEPYLGWPEHHGRGALRGEKTDDREEEIERGREDATDGLAKQFAGCSLQLASAV